MADFELFAPDDATMQQALAAIGVRRGDGLTVNKVRFCVNYYGQKRLPTGATIVDANGMTQQVTATQPGVYAIVRWIPPSAQLLAFPPAGVLLPAGVTAIALPSNSPIKFA